MSLDAYHQVLVDVHISNRASPKTYSVLLKTRLPLQLAEHGDELEREENCEMKSAVFGQDIFELV